MKQLTVMLSFVFALYAFDAHAASITVNSSLDQDTIAVVKKAPAKIKGNIPKGGTTSWSKIKDLFM